MPPEDNILDSLTGTIESVQDRIKRYRHGTTPANEDRTRHALIDPILRALGWEDPSVITVEYVIKFPLAVQKKLVDYALHHPDQRGDPIVFVEAKRLKEDIEKHLSKASQYAKMRKDSLQYLCLTNGDHWKLYKLIDGKPQSPVLDFSISKKSASDCAHIFLEHFPLHGLDDARSLSQPQVPTPVTEIVDVVPHAPEPGAVARSRRTRQVDILKALAWFAVCIIPFGIIGWITGVLTVQPTHTFFAYIGLVGVAAILFTIFFLVRSFFPLDFHSVLDTLLSMLRLSGPITLTTWTFVVLAVICGAGGGGVLGHFIGLWTAQRVADMLEFLGLITTALGILAILILLAHYRDKKKASR